MKNILTLFFTLFVLTGFGQITSGYTSIDSTGYISRTLPYNDTIKADTTIDFVFIVDSSGFVKRKKVWKVAFPQWIYGLITTISEMPLPTYLDFDTKKEIKEEDIVQFLIMGKPAYETLGSFLVLYN